MNNENPSVYAAEKCVSLAHSRTHTHAYILHIVSQPRRSARASECVCCAVCIISTKQLNKNNYYFINYECTKNTMFEYQFLLFALLHTVCFCPFWLKHCALEHRHTYAAHCPWLCNMHSESPSVYQRHKCWLPFFCTPTRVRFHRQNAQYHFLRVKDARKMWFENGKCYFLNSKTLLFVFSYLSSN